MTEQQKAKRLYEGKLFYVKQPDGTLDGPRNDIYYAARHYSGLAERFKAFFERLFGEKEYKFVQVTDRKIVQCFLENEIVVVKS